MTSLEIYSFLSTLDNNEHHLKRYCNFIEKCSLSNSKKTRIELGYTEKHHILPKALFPEYKSFKHNKWNKVYLTFRQHILCHYMLMKAFPSIDSMAYAFNMMATSKKLTKLNIILLEEAKCKFIQRMSQFHSGKRKTEEAIQKSAISRRGMKRSAESKERMSKSQIGKVLSPETREKIRNTSIGKIHSAETKKKMSGRNVSPQTREKISKIHTGKKVSIETREKMRKSQTGKILSLETKQKMSIARKKYLENKQQKESE